MKIPGWTYYNHAAIPTVPPHATVETESVANAEIWKLDGIGLVHSVNAVLKMEEIFRAQKNSKAQIKESRNVKIEFFSRNVRLW